ncbi:hypothetical protein OF846_001474 [Rhodotorula toruloides]|nr:hypothetical protein OF846_001474 [Rhodotorula toruloides]
MFGRVAGRLLGGAFGSSSPARQPDADSPASINLGATSTTTAQMAGASGSGRANRTAGGSGSDGGAARNSLELEGTVNPADTLALPGAGSGDDTEGRLKKERRKKRKAERKMKKQAALEQNGEEMQVEEDGILDIGELPSASDDSDCKDDSEEERKLPNRRSLLIRLTSPNTPSGARLSSLRKKRPRKSVTPEFASDDSPRPAKRKKAEDGLASEEERADAAGGSGKGKGKGGNLATKGRRSERVAGGSDPQQALLVTPPRSEESDAEPEEPVDLRAKDIKDLQNPHLSRDYKKLSLGYNASIRIGEIIELQRTSGRWLGAVEQIRALTSDLSLTGGRPQATGVSLQISWLYSREDLLGLNLPNLETRNCTPSTQSRRFVRANQHFRSRSVYLFDDSYPAEPPNGDTSPHPLCPYRTDTLINLTPSGYAVPALSTPTSTSRHAFHSQTQVPPYFFGVSAISPFEDEERPLRLHGGRDGVPQVPYVRTAFAFEPHFEHNSDEEDMESEAGSVSASAKKKGKRKSKRREKKVWPMQFVPHSTDDDPYNPRCAQHFSRAAGMWFNVDDLLKAKKYRKVKSGKAASSAPSDKANTHSFTFELPERTASRLSKHTSTSESATASSSTDDFNPRNASVPEVMARLAQLADSKIVRGGAFGLTGNAYLVTRAENIAHLLDIVESDIGLRVQKSQMDMVEREGWRASSSDRANLLGEGRLLLEAAQAWRDEVDRRVKGVQEGKGLAMEWRRTGDEKLPSGCEWICPKSGKAI